MGLNFTFLHNKKRTQIAIVVILVASIGIYTLLTSHAASPYVTGEGETGTIGGGAVSQGDAAASGGNFVKFGSGNVAAAFPLKLSSNNRYLVDQNNQPFYYAADTQWILFSELTRAQADAYMQTRKSQGFNTVQAYMVDWTFGYKDTDGQTAFLTSDMTQPNPAYFSHVDDVINDAAAMGMQLVLGPWELDSSAGQGKATVANYSSFGQYLGNRYKNFNNIIWMMGGDHDPINTYGDDANVDYTPQITAEANGIKQFDTRHLITYHPHRQSSGFFQNTAWESFNMIQFNRSASGANEAKPYAYDWVLHDYNLSPTKPTVLAEPAYEPHDAYPNANQPTSPYDVRRSAYWAALSGALGVGYGSNGCCSVTNPAYDAYITAAGATYTGYLAKLMSGLPWTKLVPDQNHTVVTAGYGTYGANTYVTTERASDGSAIIAYLPATTTVTVNMTQLSGTAKAVWFDPNKNTSTIISGSPFANSGSRQFTPPSTNGGGSPDFVLILTTN